MSTGLFFTNLFTDYEEQLNFMWESEK